MPPSISSHSLARSDSGAHSKVKQSFTDFQARRKLLGTSDGKKTKKKRTVSKKKTESQKTIADTATSTAVDGNTAANNALLTTPVSPYGMGMGGVGMMGMGGMYGGMYGGGMYGSPYGMGMGPLNSLNQFLFGVQTAIYSLTSAVQVVGMNAQALHQLLDAASSMVDHALATWHEMRALEATSNENETQEQKMRRRRLKALRWAMVVAATYAAYRLVRSIMSSRKSRQRRRITSTSEPHYASSSATTPYHNSGYNHSPYSGGYGGGMYGAGGGYGMGYGAGGAYY